MDIIIAGIGGQGTILASNILSHLLVLEGYDVKKSEIHGMSQRGGSVISHVRYSKDKVHAPTVRLNSANLILSFHPNETRRYAHLLKEDAIIVQLQDQDKDKLPNPKSLNVYGLGLLSKHLPIQKERWVEAIKDMLKPHLQETNLKAFELGLQA